MSIAADNAEESFVPSFVCEEEKRSRGSLAHFWFFRSDDDAEFRDQSVRPVRGRQQRTVFGPVVRMYRGMREGGHEQSGQLITAERRKDEGWRRIMTKEDLGFLRVPPEKKVLFPLRRTVHIPLDPPPPSSTRPPCGWTSVSRRTTRSHFDL